jgi:polysaccharide biosynthesis protein PslF
MHMTLVTQQVGALRGSVRPKKMEEVKVAYLSSYPPRECGIATFCEDLLQAAGGGTTSPSATVIAMEGRASPHQYTRPVVHVVDDQDEHRYRAAAEFINDSPAEVVSLQHEFGLYGGVEGQGLYRFLDALHKPLLTTLHTVLPSPAAPMRQMVRALAEKSQRLMVMNLIAGEILRRDYGVPLAKVAFVHHGAPAPTPESREALKSRLGLTGRKVMCTFGLVGAGKGLEHALRALPPVVQRHPELVYLIVGQTHPGALRDGVDEYRAGLTQLAQELGLAANVRFVNRYLTKDEIIAYLAASDIYITPYLNPHQICSGTLAYAVAAGRAIVSTPYLYARFLLGSGRGLLADFADAEALAGRVAQVLEAPGLQAQLEARTRAYGERLRWPEVGAHYRRLLREVRGEPRRSPRGIARSPAIVARPRPPVAEGAAR